MSDSIKQTDKFHPSSKHQGGYDFNQLTATFPDLKKFITANKYGKVTIDFSNPNAVKALNKALLKHFYGIDHWDIPDDYLCPPIPGRAEYIHHLADVICTSDSEKRKVKCLDIGVGANCIYPIVAVSQYNWQCVGSEIDEIAVECARRIVNTNPILKGKVEIRHQQNSQHIFAGIIKADERFDVSICNPPFYAGREEVEAATARKNKNLHKGKINPLARNFGGKSGELYTEGGELKFVTNMIRQSVKYQRHCEWFTSLVSRESHLKKFSHELKAVEAKEVKIISMNFGNKKSRILIWRF
ncbi:MAG: 23S rRNA (adenine(1618)-N(6))-methyltransferase RlmF [Crocinitomicaceae bacterium]